MREKLYYKLAIISEHLTNAVQSISSSQCVHKLMLFSESLRSLVIGLMKGAPAGGYHVKNCFLMMEYVRRELKPIRNSSLPLFFVCQWFGSLVRVGNKDLNMSAWVSLNGIT